MTRSVDVSSHNLLPNFLRVPELQVSASKNCSTSCGALPLHKGDNQYAKSSNPWFQWRGCRAMYFVFGFRRRHYVSYQEPDSGNHRSIVGIWLLVTDVMT